MIFSTPFFTNSNSFEPKIHVRLKVLKILLKFKKNHRSFIYSNTDSKHAVLLSWVKNSGSWYEYLAKSKPYSKMKTYKLEDQEG